MRRSVMVLVALFAAMVVMNVQAQQQQQRADNESKLYVSTVYINRVYTHRLGYKIVYERNDLTLGEAYIPNQWFRSAAGKAELINTASKSAPYMEIYYENGSFKFVRLYVSSNRNDPSWGSLRRGEVPAESFNEDVLNISY